MNLINKIELRGAYKPHLKVLSDSGGAYKPHTL